MAETIEKLKTQLGKLTSHQRAELADYLLHSLQEGEDVDADAAWEVELKRRVSDIESGNVSGKPAAQVLSELKAKYS